MSGQEAALVDFMVASGAMTVERAEAITKPRGPRADYMREYMRKKRARGKT